mgnify:FL=1
MSEYIERAAAMESIIGLTIVDPAVAQYANAVYYNLQNLPAADVVEVRHAHWEFPVFTDSDDGLDPRVKCSECGGIEAAFARWKYCPNCSARIDKEDDHEIAKP